MSDNSTNISAQYDLEYRTTMRKSKFVFFTLIRNLSAMVRKTMKKKKRGGGGGEILKFRKLRDKVLAFRRLCPGAVPSWTGSALGFHMSRVLRNASDGKSLEKWCFCSRTPVWSPSDAAKPG